MTAARERNFSTQDPKGLQPFGVNRFVMKWQSGRRPSSVYPASITTSALSAYGSSASSPSSGEALRVAFLLSQLNR